MLVAARGQRDASAQPGHNFFSSEAITSYIAVKLVKKLQKLSKST